MTRFFRLLFALMLLGLYGVVIHDPKTRRLARLARRLRAKMIFPAAHAYTFAGSWSPGTFVYGSLGGDIVPAAGAALQIALVGGADAADNVWTTRLRSANAPTLLTLDGNGNLAEQFLDPGDYQYTVTPVGGSTSGPFTFHVSPDAAEPSVEEGDLVVEGGIATAPSAAPSTTSLSTGTPFHNMLGYDIEVRTPVTYTATTSPATLKSIVSSSSPGSAGATEVSIPATAATPLAGTVLTHVVHVPAGWYLRLDVAQAVLGTSVITPI
jgi:hypothetical protein